MLQTFKSSILDDLRGQIIPISIKSSLKAWKLSALKVKDSRSYSVSYREALLPKYIKK